jgi:predicted metalloprotease with PDZ domain
MKDYTEIIVARYGMSFYYWISMEEELGSQTIREIVDQLKELQDPNNGNIEKVIRDAAGQNYVERIENLAADEALEFLSKSMRHIIPKVRNELSSNQRPIRIAAYEVLHRLDKDIFDIDLPDIATTARIADIAPDTPAYHAGLRHGDIIEYVDGDLVESFDEFSENAGFFYEPEIEVKVLRRGTMQSLKLKSFAGCKFQPLAR